MKKYLLIIILFASSILFSIEDSISSNTVNFKDALFNSTDVQDLERYLNADDVISFQRAGEIIFKYIRNGKSIFSSKKFKNEIERYLTRLGNNISEYLNSTYAYSDIEDRAALFDYLNKHPQIKHYVTIENQLIELKRSIENLDCKSDLAVVWYQIQNLLKHKLKYFRDEAEHLKKQFCNMLLYLKYLDPETTDLSKVNDLLKQIGNTYQKNRLIELSQKYPEFRQVLETAMEFNLTAKDKKKLN